MTIKSNDIKKAIINGTTLQAKDLSVRKSNGGLSTSFHVELKKEFPVSQIESITSKFESIDRCERTGEILMGCNVYINISYLWEMVLSEKMIDDIEKYINQLIIPQDFTTLEKNTLIGRYLAKNIDGYTYHDIMQLLRSYYRNL